MKEREEESEEGDGWNEGGGRGKRGRRISWKFPAKYYRDENVELIETFVFWCRLQLPSSEWTVFRRETATRTYGPWRNIKMNQGKKSWSEILWALLKLDRLSKDCFPTQVSLNLVTFMFAIFLTSLFLDPSELNFFSESMDEI